MARRITLTDASIALAVIDVILGLIPFSSISRLDYIVRIHVVALAVPILPATAVLIATVGLIIRLAGGQRREIVFGCLLALTSVEAAVAVFFASLIPI